MISCPKRDNTLCGGGRKRTTIFYLVTVPESGNPQQEPGKPMVVADSARIP